MNNLNIDTLKFYIDIFKKVLKFRNRFIKKYSTYNTISANQYIIEILTYFKQNTINNTNFDKYLKKFLNLTQKIHGFNNTNMINTLQENRNTKIVDIINFRKKLMTEINDNNINDVNKIIIEIIEKIDKENIYSNNDVNHLFTIK